MQAETDPTRGILSNSWGIFGFLHTVSLLVSAQWRPVLLGYFSLALNLRTTSFPALPISGPVLSAE